MAKVEKMYSSKAAAKKALSRIFGAGIFYANGTHASANFIEGIVKEDGCLALRSSYWTEQSLKAALKMGVNKLQ